MKQEIAQAVIERAGGYCEKCGEVLKDYHLHHRKLRKHGGPDTIENLMVVSAACHQAIHASPLDSYESGWLVPSWADPATTPIAPHGDYPWGK